MAHPTRGVGSSGASGRTSRRTAHGTGRAGGGRSGDRDSRTAYGRRADEVEPAAAPPLNRQELVALRARLHALIEPVVIREGLDLEEVAVSRMGRRYLVRITVDADGGIGHEELSDVSRAVSAAMDEAEERSGELTPGAYTLEISSPGIDRALTQPRHWHRNVGRLVAVKVAGRPVTGRVTATDTQGVSLDVDGRRLDATFDELGPGRVQVEFTRLDELTESEFGPELSDDERED